MDISGEIEVNRWKIPGWLEQEVLARDQACVYCRVNFSPLGVKSEMPISAQLAVSLNA